MPGTDHHFHKDEQGMLVKCYHKTKNVMTDWGFWIGLTIGYPLEHALWEHVAPFKWLTEYLQHLH